MKTEIQYKGLQVSANLEEQLNKDFKIIEEKFSWVDHIIVHLIKDKSCTCELIARGKMQQELFVKDEDEKFEKAITNAFDKLDRQLRKIKEKLFAK